MTYILLIVGFTLLIVSANLLVDGSSALARRLNIPDIIIGLTVVAFGTSAPELVVSLIAALNGESALCLTNVLGSNMINVFVILGISAMIFPLSCSKNTLRYEIPISMFAIITLIALSYGHLNHSDSNSIVINRIDGCILLLCFCAFIAYIVFQSKKGDDTEECNNIPNKPLWRSIFLITLGLGGLIGGGKIIVDNVVAIAMSLNIPTEIIGVTIVALGTSLPELATSVVAAYKKNADIAIGNVIGSNIFNVLLIVGLSSVIAPLYAYSNLLVDAYMTTAASAILLIFVASNKKHRIKRWHGLILVFIYIIYLIWLIKL